MNAYGVGPAILGAIGAVHFPDTVSIYSVGPTVLPSGQPDPDAAPVARPGLANLVARVGPMIRIRPTDRLDKRDDFTRVRIERHVMLKTYQPTIVPGNLCEYGSEFFEIYGVEHDGNHILTRLRLVVVDA
jgi:hypothetical protein